MNKKLLRLFGTLLLAMVCLGATAQTSTFKYTATEKLPRFEEYQYFVGSASNVFSSEDGVVIAKMN